MLCILMIVQVLPIIDLVRGIPCAVTKRRHLRRALLQYLDEFDTCKCAPCPNNAKPVLSGTECQCVCQTGTFGTNCEKRAPDYTSGTAAICLVLGGEKGKGYHLISYHLILRSLTLFVLNAVGSRTMLAMLELH